jgi:hypothetical protein
LLGNDPANIFPFKHVITIQCPFLGNISVNMFQHATMGAVLAVRGPCQDNIRSQS